MENLPVNQASSLSLEESTLGSQYSAFFVHNPSRDFESFLHHVKSVEPLITIRRLRHLLVLAIKVIRENFWDTPMSVLFQWANSTINDAVRTFCARVVLSPAVVTPDQEQRFNSRINKAINSFRQAESNNKTGKRKQKCEDLEHKKEKKTRNEAIPAAMKQKMSEE